MDWPVGFATRCHGVRIGVRASDPELLEVLSARLPAHARPIEADIFDAIFSVRRGGRRPGTRIRDFHMAYHDHTRIGRAHDLDEVLGRFDAYLALVIAALSPRRVFVHAGAVEWKGRSILVPGATHTGKSTLVIELVRRGATYLSDEFAVLDEKGRVHPWPRPIALRSEPGGRQRPVDMASLGGARARGGVEPGMIVLTGWRENARWRPVEVGPGKAVLGLMEHAVAARLSPARVTGVLATHAMAARAIRSPRGEAADVAGRILEQAERI